MQFISRPARLPDIGNILSWLQANGLSDSMVCWIRDGKGFLGWGKAARFDIPPGPDRITRAQLALRAYIAQTSCTGESSSNGLVGFGSFTFDPRSQGSVVIVPRTLLEWGDGQSWITTVDSPDKILNQLTSVSNSPLWPEIQFSSGSLSDQEWIAAAELAIKTIRSGAVDKVVLARDIIASASTSIPIAGVIGNLLKKFDTCYTFSCDGLVGATPELLVKRSGRVIESLLLAGSQRRGHTRQEDQELAQVLRASDKDEVEHRLAVESLSETLKYLCAQLSIDSAPRLIQLSNVQHLATQVHGELADPATSALDVVSALHPTGAVCGTPTPVALDTINELEGMDRGRYAGPIGWMSANGDGEWGIALRCAQISHTQARLFAGSGLVTASNPGDELAETEFKFDAMRSALLG